MLTGENGILTQAIKAKDETENAKLEEENILNSYEDYINGQTGDSWNEEKGVNAPILKDGMEAVYWDNKGDEITQSDNNFDEDEWYDYNNNKWANAKTKDGSYWVWIPRFEYQITNEVTEINTAGTIDVNFIQTSRTSPSDSNFYIHPAFRNDSSNDYANGGWDSEISGFWIAKYEMSMEDESGNHLETTKENGNVLLNDKIKMVSKPKVSSWRWINLGNIYTNSYNYDRKKESHLMKNSEWGAVAVLTHSKYGRNGEEISINNSNSFITGSSAGRPGASSSDAIYDYDTVEGQKASSTGNITGIYDLSGGSWERVSAFNSNYQGIYFTGNEYLDAKGEHFAGTGKKSTKYATAYFNNTTEETYGNFDIGTVSIQGDIIKEVYIKNKDGWFDDISAFVNIEIPFFCRGGYYDNANDAGVFCSTNHNGAASQYHSFRVVLI